MRRGNCSSYQLESTFREQNPQKTQLHFEDRLVSFGHLRQRSFRPIGSWCSGFVRESSGGEHGGFPRVPPRQHRLHQQIDDNKTIRFWRSDGGEKCNFCSWRFRLFLRRRDFKFDCQVNFRRFFGTSLSLASAKTSTEMEGIFPISLAGTYGTRVRTFDTPKNENDALGLDCFIFPIVRTTVDSSETADTESKSVFVVHVDFFHVGQLVLLEHVEWSVHLTQLRPRADIHRRFRQERHSCRVSHPVLCLVG
jgi:hypothetical protein